MRDFFKESVLKNGKKKRLTEAKGVLGNEKVAKNLRPKLWGKGATIQRKSTALEDESEENQKKKRGAGGDAKRKKRPHAV